MKRRLSITDWIYNMDLGIKRGLRTECRLPATVRVFYARIFALLTYNTYQNSMTHSLTYDYY